jgi:hypothetical protein
MAQIFPRSANAIAKASVVLVAILGGAVAAAGAAFFRSDYVTGVGDAKAQPVQFSHNHHVAGVGLDCRYCHSSVEKSQFAGIPPTRTCMTCHSQIFNEAPILEPVRESYRTDKSLEWVRLHDLANFAYFNHQIHVNKGVGCTTCHGKIDEMQLTFKDATLFMEWCLQCHRNPEKNLREKADVFKTDFKFPTPERQHELATDVYKIQSKELLTSCSTCHR